MVKEFTHASFFSGVGGLDLGLERAGWRTVSVSEIDPYACEVLKLRFPDAVQLGSITDIAADSGPDDRRDTLAGRGAAEPIDQGRDGGTRDWVGVRPDWRTATLWSGGFPCQDLSVAGKRRGMGTSDERSGTRSGLAYAFLDLVEQHRPPMFLLENVPGLLSSNSGLDFYSLQRQVAELGYGMAFRIFDARHFGVPQRRKRVFIFALRSGADDPDGRVAAERAAEVLAVGTCCPRHPASGCKAWQGTAEGVGDSPRVTGFFNSTAAFGQWEPGDIAGTLSQRDYKSSNHLIANAVRASDGHHGHGSPRGDGGDNLVVGAPTDPMRNRVADGMADGLDHRAGVDVQGREVAATLRGFGHGWQGQHMSTNAVFVKGKRAQTADDDESWREGDVAPTLNSFDVGDTRATVAVLGEGQTGDDPLLPPGLDSHRYRCCGNGVVAPVAEWIGWRLHALMSQS